MTTSNYDIVWETLTHQNCTKVEVTNDDGTVTIKEEYDDTDDTTEDIMIHDIGVLMP